MTGFTIKSCSANSLSSLVVEWRDARQAVFDADFGRLPLSEHDAYWKRLGKAENNLMDFARNIGPDGLSLP